MELFEAFKEFNKKEKQKKLNNKTKNKYNRIGEYIYVKKMKDECKEKNLF